MLYLGIDIGATKTAVCIGERDGRIRVSERIPTEGHRDADLYFRRLFPLCRKLVSQVDIPFENIDAIGIGAPGPVDVANGIILESPNMTGWHNVPVVARVEEAFGRPVLMNNDANAGVLAEYHFGAHRGTRNIVYLTHSTGMGGGIIANGRLLQGVSDTGGEVGHQILDPDGPPCECGLRGCFEAYCGGLSVANQIRARIRDESVHTRILELVDGDVDRIDFKVFVQAARDADSFALAAWEQYLERLAQGVGNLIMILNPEVIILGTIATQTGAFLMDPLREKVRRYAWEWPLDACTIDTSSLGGQIGDLGALAVALGSGEKRREKKP